MKELILQLLLDEYENVDNLLNHWNATLPSDFIEISFPNVDLRRLKGSDYRLLKDTVMQVIEELK